MARALARKHDRSKMSVILRMLASASTRTEARSFEDVSDPADARLRELSAEVPEGAVTCTFHVVRGDVD